MISLRPIGFVLLAACSVSAARAQPPQIAAVWPPGGAAGSTVHARIEGANLAGATAALISEEGVRLTLSDAGKEASALPVTLEIASDAAPGPREVRVITPKGGSNPGYIWVGALPEVAETEPSEQPDQAVLLTDLPVTVFGRANKAEDVDWFAFQASAGDTFVFDICATRLYSQIDPFLELRDSRGRLLEMATEGYDRDPRLIYTFKTAGSYRLQVRDLQYRGGAGYIYKLSVGKLPAITSHFPPGGRLGEQLEARVQGVNLGGMTTLRVAIPRELPAAHPWYVAPHTPSGPALPVSIAADDNPQMTEPESTAPRQPTPLPAGPVTVNGRIAAAREVDTYLIEAAQGRPLRISVAARNVGSRLDPYMRILDAAGKELFNSEEQIGRDLATTFVPPAGGAYRLEVSGLGSHSGPDYYYRLSIRPAGGAPDFRLTASPDVFSLGKGQTLVMNIQAERRDFDGPIDVRVEGLPSGVTASALTLGPGQSSGILTLTAAADPPMQSGITRIIGEAAVAGMSLVRKAVAVGSYPRPGEGQAVDRPVAFQMAWTTDAVPLFTLAAETSLIPLAPGETVTVKIRAARKPGDNNAQGAIALAFAGLPPGVTAETPAIPEKQGEVAIKLTVAADAQPIQQSVLLTGKLGENSQPAPAIRIQVKPR